MDTTLPERDLIPARMVNEFVYCPRLAYLEWVQGEWRDNPDTEAGRHAHRRVDRKDKGLPEPDALEADTRIHVRSVTLGDPELGLIAKLDLVEGESNRVSPVDYKKGKRPHIAAGVYDPERVQLCAQGLLLRKHGYQSDEGVIYYVASKEKVHVPFDEDLIRLTLEATDNLRRLQDSEIPPPLDDSPKCPRCSLVSICLPDEVNWFHRLDEAPRPIAVRDEDKMPLYVQAPFATIRKKGEVLEIEVNDEKQTARIGEISQLALFGNIHLTTPALQTLMQREIPVTWHSQGGWYYGHAQGVGHKNIQMRIQQFQAAFDKERSLQIARSLVRAKILNCRTLLRRNWRNDSVSPDKLLLQLKYYAGRAARAADIATLLGIEGQAAAIYFGAFANLLRQTDADNAFDFTQRNRRPPRDPVNALLSFAYSILARTWATTLQGVGFDPYMGFYHQPRPGRPALALDMMETFRPLLADSAVITAINNGEVGTDDFVTSAGSCTLSNKGRKAFIATIERRFSQQVTHPHFGYRLSYRRLLELEARVLGRFLMGEIDHYPGFVTR